MKIIVSRKDGGVSIMTLQDHAAEANKLAPNQIETIVQAELAQWSKVDQDAVVSWRMMEDAAIPDDRTFRNAWRDTTPEAVIDVDMTKARDIQRDRLRAMRDPMLAELDTAYMRADETGDTAKKQDIAVRKQVLRDVTDDPAIEAASTPEELKAVIPAALEK